MLGVTIQPVTSDIAASLRLDNVRGALVNSVEAGGPADKAGVKRGDVIVAINGVPVRDSNTLRNHVAEQKPGTEMKLTVVRDGREESLTATLGRLAGEIADAKRENAPDRTAIWACPCSRSRQRPRSSSASRREHGLLVTAVEPASAAEAAGFQPRDVITEVNGQQVDSVAALKSAIGKSEGRPALVLANRNGQSVYLTLSNS